MKITPHLGFDGDCSSAFDFYAQVLNGKVTFKMTWGESPMANNFPPEYADRIIHSTLTIGDVTLMGADAPPGYYEKPGGLNVSIEVADTDEASRIFNQLAENGAITMPFQPTFWSKGFGMCVDRFGIPWMISGASAH